MPRIDDRKSGARDSRLRRFGFEQPDDSCSLQEVTTMDRAVPTPLHLHLDLNRNPDCAIEVNTTSSELVEWLWRPGDTTKVRLRLRVRLRTMEGFVPNSWPNRIARSHRAVLVRTVLSFAQMPTLRRTMPTPATRLFSFWRAAQRAVWLSPQSGANASRSAGACCRQARTL